MTPAQQSGRPSCSAFARDDAHEVHVAVVATGRDPAARLGLERISDLSSHPELRLGFSNEFMDRSDGWPGLRDLYGLNADAARGLQHDLAYRALVSGDIDVIDLYSTDAEIAMARVDNFANPDDEDLEDFGEISLKNANASGYIRVDWYTPDGMPVWGDGRTFILGSTGSLEVRKYIDLNRQVPAAKIFLTDQHKVEEIDCLGVVGFPFFGQLIMDSLNGTDSAMSQAHIFKAAELSMQAQSLADQHG